MQTGDRNFADKINLCVQFLQVLPSFFTICCSVRSLLMHSLIVIISCCQWELSTYLNEEIFISGLIWCPYLASEEKKGGEKNTKKWKHLGFFQDNQALLLCKACQMAYQVKTTSGHHAFLFERWQISSSVQSVWFLEEECFIQGQKIGKRKQEIFFF